MAVLSSSPPANLIPSLSFTSEKGNCRRGACSITVSGSKRAQFHSDSCKLEVGSSLLTCPLKGKSFVSCGARMSSMATMENKQNHKQVWLWTKSKQVMTASVERGWNTFIFSENDRELSKDWSSIALIHPLFIGDGELVDSDGKRVASFCEVSSTQQLQQFQRSVQQAENVIMSLLDWQVIPAENLVAAFQGSEKTVFSVAKSHFEAQVFLEALEQGLGGVVLKVEDVVAVVELKGYLDKRNDSTNLLSLTKATITKVQVVGMGDRVCVDLCSLMRPGEGLLVGSFARGLFLVHSECLESNYIASRPFRVNAGPVHAYVAVPGGKTCYLSELQAGREVIVVSQNGQQRTAIVGRVKIECRPLILVEAKVYEENLDNGSTYSIPLQNAETVGLVCPLRDDEPKKTVIPVTSLKIGDEVQLRVQGGARHTGIEIQEFIVEK